MNTPVTSPEALSSQSVDAQPSIKVIVREFSNFLGKPTLLGGTGWRAPGNLRRWATILTLQIGGLFVILPLLSMWQKAFDLPAPTAFENVDPKLLPWLVVLIAPVLEELIFRGWQSGRPRALWLFLCAIVGTIAAVGARLGGADPMVVLGVTIGTLVAAVTGWIALRRREAAGWFAKYFRAIYYGAVLLFAAMHLANYPSFSLLAVPLVLPQAWAGLTLGYLRQQVGLTSSMAAHAVSNAIMLSIALTIGG